MKFCIGLVLLGLLSACSSNPPCKTPSELAGNAGCLIVHGEQFLVARHRKKDKWNLPGGTAEAGESAQCTAARETREELGVEVDVGALLHQHDNGFYLFSCDLKVGQYRGEYSVPLSGVTEVSGIAWLELEDVKAEDWRYPQRWPIMQGLIQEQLPKLMAN